MNEWSQQLARGMGFHRYQSDAFEHNQFYMRRTHRYAPQFPRWTTSIDGGTTYRSPDFCDSVIWSLLSRHYGPTLSRPRDDSFTVPG